MKKVIYSLVIMIAASSLFTSCIQPVEEAGINALRVAKAKYIESLTGLKSAEATKTNAEAEYIKAQAAVEQANVAVVAAQAEYIKAETAYKEAEAKVKEAEAKLVEAQAAAIKTEAEAQAAALMAEAAKLQAEADSLKAIGSAQAAKIQAEADAIAKEAEAAIKVAEAEAAAKAQESAAYAAKLQAEAEAALIAANSAAESEKIAAQAIAEEKAAAAQAALIAAQADADRVEALAAQIKAQTDAEAKAAQQELEIKAREEANAAAIEAANLKARLEEAEAALIAAQTEKTKNEELLAEAKASLEQALKDIAAEATNMSASELAVVTRYEQAYNNLIAAKEKVDDAQAAYDMACYDNGASVGDQEASIGLVKTDNIKASYELKIAELKSSIALYEGYIAKFKESEPTDFEKWDAELKAMEDTIDMYTLAIGQLTKDFEIYKAKEFTDGVNAIEAAQAAWFKDNADRWQTPEAIEDVFSFEFELPNNPWFSGNFAAYAMYYASNTSVYWNDEGKIVVKIEGNFDQLHEAVEGKAGELTNLGLSEIVKTLQRENVVTDFQEADLAPMKAAKEAAAKAYKDDYAYLQKGFEASKEYSTYLTNIQKKAADTLAKWNDWQKKLAITNLKYKSWKDTAAVDSAKAYTALQTTTKAEAAKFKATADELVAAIANLKGGYRVMSYDDSTRLIKAIGNYFTAKQSYIGAESRDTIMILRGYNINTWTKEQTPIYDTVNFASFTDVKKSIKYFQQEFTKIKGSNYWYAYSLLGSSSKESTGTLLPYPCYNYLGAIIPVNLKHDAIARVLSTILVRNNGSHYVRWHNVKDFNESVEKIAEKNNWEKLEDILKAILAGTATEDQLREYGDIIAQFAEKYQPVNDDDYFDYAVDEATIQNVRWMEYGWISKRNLRVAEEVAYNVTDKYMAYRPIYVGDYPYLTDPKAQYDVDEYGWFQIVAKANAAVKADLKKYDDAKAASIKAMNAFISAKNDSDKAKKYCDFVGTLPSGYVKYADYAVNQMVIAKNGYYDVYKRFWGICEGSNAGRYFEFDKTNYKNFLKDFSMDSLVVNYTENTFMKDSDGEDPIAWYAFQYWDWDKKAFNYDNMKMLPNPKMSIVLQNMSVNVYNWDPNYCHFFFNDEATEYSKMLASEQCYNAWAMWIDSYDSNTEALADIAAKVAELPNKIYNVEQQYAAQIAAFNEAVEDNQTLLEEFFGKDAMPAEVSAKKMVNDGKTLEWAAKYALQIGIDSGILDPSTRSFDLSIVGGYQLELCQQYLASFPVKYYELLDAIDAKNDYVAESERIAAAIKGFATLAYAVITGDQGIDYDTAKAALVEHITDVLAQWQSKIDADTQLLATYEKALDLYNMGYDPQQVVINAAKEALQQATDYFNEMNDLYTIAKAAYDKLIAGYTAE